MRDEILQILQILNGHKVYVHDIATLLKNLSLVSLKAFHLSGYAFQLVGSSGFHWMVVGILNDACCKQVLVRLVAV